MINEYLHYARVKGASDVHLTVGLPPIMRTTGLLNYMTNVNIGATEMEGLYSELVDEKQKERFSLGDDLDFAYTTPDGSRHRVNIYRQKGTKAIAIRLLNSVIPTLDQLGMPEVMKTIASMQRGLILVTGPTGSGKSTTLAAMLDVVNSTRKAHILTLEDPIEYLHKAKKSMVNQREIGVDAYSFAHALRSALREDPDVILVGEMRDYETISLALTAAETGHLVFSTLHTSSAAQTIDRIIDVFPPNQQAQVRTQLSTTLKAIVSQKLLPTTDNVSRCAALEILINNEAVGNMIRECKAFQIPTVMQTHTSEGMQTLDMHLALLVKTGKISQDVANENCIDPQNLKRLIGATTYYM